MWTCKVCVVSQKRFHENIVLNIARKMAYSASIMPAAQKPLFFPQILLAD